MTTLRLRKSISPGYFWGFLLIPVLFGCVALSPTARADDDNRGNQNTSEGAFALGSLSTGHYNTANGYAALYKNTTGNYNTANGFDALYNNASGGNNTANGAGALHNNTGGNNTANGYGALFSNTTGGYNTANGVGALYSNQHGSENTANGFGALYNATGNNNIALGASAGYFLTTGSFNIYIGSEGLPNGSNESNTIRIGTEGTQTATFIAGIANAMVTGSAVYINTTTGRLGLLSSSKRFKDAIEPMGTTSEALLLLRPVTFHYKKTIDPKCAPQFGLVAEEVEKVNPDLVVRDAEGKAFTVRYEAVNAMLLNEFLKEHRKVQGLESTVAKQEITIAQQQKQIAALTTGLQKVSTQLGLRRPAPQTVANNQ